MLSWPPTVRIFVCSNATDMRKGFDSLAYLVESSLALDPFSGHLFVFRSRRGDRIKILYWDADGYVLWSALSQNGQAHATRRMRRLMNRRIFAGKPAADGSDEYSSCIASRRNS
jgi:transposase